MDKLYKYTNNKYRSRSISTMVLCTEEEINGIDGQEIYISDFLGKHGHAEFTIKKEDFELITDDQEFIEKVKGFEILNLVGFNPFDYYEPETYSDDDDCLDAVEEPAKKEKVEDLEATYKESLLYMYTLNDKVKTDLKNGHENLSDLYTLKTLSRKHGVKLNKRGALARHAKSAEVLWTLMEEKEKYKDIWAQ